MTLLYLYKKLERHVHPITKKTFRSFPAQFFQRWLPEFSLEKTFCALFLRMILTFRVYSYCELSFSAPSAEAEADREDPDSSKFDFSVSLFLDAF